MLEETGNENDENKIRTVERQRQFLFDFFRFLSEIVQQM